ncbi:hypothetical protein MNBD_NITROSPINAE02-787 [hydrothermal vent metagenome]|uniref:Spore protein YkvP/CgeB glycosyl transferase-like domain-containing protein n=1 Tax=hydrothermal vent metagenome TaxID=652676 RepID=A0A3B1CCQ3_9ZZZZ
MNFLENNLKALALKNGRLARKIKHAQAPAGLVVTQSKSGFPTPRLGPVSLHSRFYPEKEGEKLARLHDASSASVCVVFGFGFGYHLEEIARQRENTIVIEPSPGVMKEALTARDLTGLLERVKIVSPEDFSEMAENLDYANALWIDHEPSARAHAKERESVAGPFLIRAINGPGKYRVMVVGPVYGGSVPTAISCAGALERLGFEVSFVDNRSYHEEIRSIDEVTTSKNHKALLREIFNNYLGEKIAARADYFRPDIILALAQAPLSPALLGRIKALGAPVVFWFVENYRTLPYWKSVAPHYDYFFGIQKGEFLDELIKAGAPYCGYLPQAADPATHRPLKLSPGDKKKYGARISFMGAGYPNRRKFFASLLDLPLKVWGTEWDLSTPLGGRVQNGNRRLQPEEYIKIFNASQINLNLHSSLTSVGVDPMADFVNPRTFEVAACGAFGLVDRRDELGEMLKVGEEIITFDDSDDLREKIAFYLDHPEEREAIAKAGMKRTLKEHTFTHRMARMMGIVLERDRAKIDRLREKASGKNNVDLIIERTKNRELKTFLEKFRGGGKLRLDEVMSQIAKGEGELTRPEAIFVMIDQILSQEQI